MAVPEGDVIEADEICVRYSPGLWLWVMVSRTVGQVLGFALVERSDEMLALCRSDVPAGYRDKPVCTDRWEGYALGRVCPVLSRRAAPGL